MPGPNSNLFKIVIVGSTQGGKTSFLERIFKNIFNLDQRTTIGTNVITTALNKIDESALTQKNDDILQIWDTAGQERFQTLGGAFHKDAGAVILMTDLSLWSSDPSTAIETEKERLNKEIKDMCNVQQGKDLPLFYLVGTKHDIAIANNIQTEALKNLNTFANQLRIPPTNGAGLPENQVFVTTSKDSVDDTNNTSQLKSPRKIINIIYTHLKKLEQAKAPTEDNTESPDTSHISAGKPSGGKTPLRIRSAYSDGTNSITTSRIMRHLYPSPIGWPNMLMGGFFGALLGALMGIVIHNPVTCFLAAWRSPDWAEWNIPNLFRIFIFAPIVNPLVATGYGFLSGGTTGAEWGVSKKLLDIPRDMSEPFKLRTIITGSVLSVFIGIAVAVAVIHLLPVALPILLGVAGAAALVAGVSYEGIDSVLTDNELQETLKNKSASKPLLAAERSSIELEAHKVLSSSTTSSPTNQNNNFMVVNVYQKALNAGSWRSWFQVPPAVSTDNPQTDSSPPVTHLSAQP